MMNYFIFPKGNIFKSLSLENMDFKKSYEEGAIEGNYLSFVISNLLDDEEVFYYYIYTNHEIEKVSYQINKLIESLTIKRFDLAISHELENIMRILFIKIK